MPEPYYFVAGTAVMCIGGVIGMADSRAGALFNWAMLLGAVVGGQAKFAQAGTESLILKNVALVSATNTAEATPGTNTPGGPLGISRDILGPQQATG